MSWATRRYVREKENLEEKRGWTTEELQASELRKQFLSKYIVNFDTHLYKTQVERDWGYIAKREVFNISKKKFLNFLLNKKSQFYQYRYDVTMKSLGYAFGCANLTYLAAVFV